MDYWICPQIDHPPNLQSLFGHTSRAGDIDHCIRVRQQVFAPLAGHTKPGLIPVAASIGPALPESEAFSDVSQIRHCVTLITNPRPAQRVIRPARSCLEVINIVSETLQPHGDL